MAKAKVKSKLIGPKGYENYPYAKLYYYMFYKPGDIAVTTGQHWVLDKKSYRDAVSEVIKGRIYNQLQKEKWKFDDLTILGIWNVSTHANQSGHFAKNTEFDKFLNRQVFVYNVDRAKSELRVNESGFDSEQIVLQDIKSGPKRIKEWLKQGNQPIEDEELPREFTPRDHLDDQDLDTFDKDFRKPSITKLDQTRVDCIRACGAGKSQTPYLAYYRTYIDFWGGKGQPINLTLGPDNGIVRGNAMGMSGHDQAVGNDTLHLVWTTDALTDLDADKRNNIIIIKHQHEVRDIKGNIVHKSLNKGEVLRKLLKDNKHRPIMIHSGMAGYYQHNSQTCLSYQMRRANKSFYWAFIDEVHRTLNADWASWSKIHDDSVVFVKHRFMPTATPNKLKSATKDYNKMYGMGEFSDVSFPKLDNVEAFKRGYIRKYKVWQLSFGDDLPTQIFEKISEGREPYIKVKGTDITVPFKYWMELKAFYEFKIENPSINHTLGVTNRIDNSRRYADFIEAVKKPMLLKRFGGNYNDPMYKRLINLHIEAMTTDEDDNGDLRAKADEIGKNHNDSLLLHCQLLGEGWNPGGTLTEKDKKYKGFIDSIQFIDPVHSKMRIAQNAGRGVRSPMLKPNCWLIMSWLNVETDNKLTDYKNNFNQRAKVLHDVAVSLGVPSEFVHDHIVLKTCKPISRSSTGSGHGPNYIDSDVEIDPFADEFLDIMEGIRNGAGAIHPLHATAEKIAKLWIDFHKINNYEFINWNPRNRQGQKEYFYSYIRNDKVLSKEIDDWYLIDIDDPKRTSKYNNILRPIVTGRHVGLSLATQRELDVTNEKYSLPPQWVSGLKTFEKEYIAQIKELWQDHNVRFHGKQAFTVEEIMRKFGENCVSLGNMFEVYKTCYQKKLDGTPLLEPTQALCNSYLRKHGVWETPAMMKLKKEIQQDMDDRKAWIHATAKEIYSTSVTDARLQKVFNAKVIEKYPYLDIRTIKKLQAWEGVRSSTPCPKIKKIQKENLKKVEHYIEQKLDNHGDEFENCGEFCDWVSSTMLADIGVDPEENSPKQYGGQHKIVMWQFAENNPNRKPKFKKAYKTFLDRTNKRMGRNNRDYIEVSVEGKLYKGFDEIINAGYTIDAPGGYKSVYKKGEVRPITDTQIRYRCNSDNFPDWFFVTGEKL